MSDEFCSGMRASRFIGYEVLGLIVIAVESGNNEKNDIYLVAEAPEATSSGFAH